MPGRPKSVKVADLPSADLVSGLHLRWTVTKEGDGADEVKMGILSLDANMADLVWDGKVDEIFYCERGRLRLLFEGDGEKGELVAEQGGAIFLPRGRHYVIKATGLESVNVFCKKL